jgi:hypothetical protein
MLASLRLTLVRLTLLPLALAAGSTSTHAQLQSGASLETRLELSPQQRASIYQALTQSHRHTSSPSVRLSIGADVPPSAELYTMPDNILAELPATKFYKYVVVQNQVVIIDPITLKVVDIIRQ